MTYEELVQEVREIFGKADVSKVSGRIAYQFNIEGESEGAFYAEVSDGTLRIEPFEYFDRDVMFTTTAETLLRIAKGEADAIEEFTLGRLKVEGDFDKALLLQQFSASDAEKTTASKAVQTVVKVASAAAKTAVKSKAAAKTATKTAAKTATKTANKTANKTAANTATKKK